MNKNPCKKCYWQAQKEHFWQRCNPRDTGHGSYQKIALIMENRCRDCQKRIDYLRAIGDPWVHTNGGDGPEIYNLNEKAILAKMD